MMRIVNEQERGTSSPMGYHGWGPHPGKPPPFGSAGTRALSIAVPSCLASDREQRQHLQMFCVRFSFRLFVFWAELLGIRAM